jgi:hypothetical protein
MKGRFIQIGEKYLAVYKNTHGRFTVAKCEPITVVGQNWDGSRWICECPTDGGIAELSAKQIQPLDYLKANEFLPDGPNCVYAKHR